MHCPSVLYMLLRKTVSRKNSYVLNYKYLTPHGQAFRLYNKLFIFCEGGFIIVCEVSVWLTDLPPLY